ncbi:PepSY domain-containing protein [Nevskia soli]|uniref:PepSY domain-containing protein n=1 Tax=Nevskia soli TaxID=418856 RepID=UPI0004A76B2E|nr:PepSY domain-containing protein [Nevskia soli]
MLRTLHAVPGLIATLLLLVVALAGAALSVFPAAERMETAAEALDVATLVGHVTARVPGVETIVRRPSGMIVAYYLVNEEQRASIIDPATGEVLAPYQPSATQRWLRNLHRKLLLSGDGGRITVGVAAALLLFIALSGLTLLAHRMGGWLRLIGPVRGPSLQRLHNEIARTVLPFLVLSAATGIAMSLATFGLLPEGGGAQPYFDVQSAGSAPMALERMAALRSIDVSRLRQVKLANKSDPSDMIEVEANDGTGVVDPSTGTWLAWQPFDGWQRLHDTVKMLHTGEGLWWLGLLLGATSLTVPLLAASGFMIWLRRRRTQPRVADNVPVRDADTLLLVGSESNMTWGFAVALHAALARAGLRTHAAAMNDLPALHPGIRRLLVLTATYGDGSAPESAGRFLSRLARSAPAPGVAFAVLGFGDRQFSHFCGYARKVHEALIAQGLKALGETGTVDRQSEPEFRQWAEWLAGTLHLALDIRYKPMLPATTELELVSRTDYGQDQQTRTAVLRFVPATRAGQGLGRMMHVFLSRLPRFETGDLLGVLPPGGAAPRYYSLASAASDGVVEICVRRQPEGVCSPWLADLAPGATIKAFIRPHKNFRPIAGAAAVILVGAGTGIGPLIGFIRHNAAARPMHLYFGARNAEDGFLYGDELKQLVAAGRLCTLSTAFSRMSPRVYVQDRLVADGQRLRELVAHGAQVMVCGGRAMADSVAQAWEGILAGSGFSVTQLKMQGRYVEDVY